MTLVSPRCSALDRRKQEVSMPWVQCSSLAPSTRSKASPGANIAGILLCPCWTAWTSSLQWCCYAVTCFYRTYFKNYLTSIRQNSIFRGSLNGGIILFFLISGIFHEPTVLGVQISGFLSDLGAVRGFALRPRLGLLLHQLLELSRRISVVMTRDGDFHSHGGNVVKTMP